jgi:hypothetical protein
LIGLMSMATTNPVMLDGLLVKNRHTIDVEYYCVGDEQKQVRTGRADGLRETTPKLFRAKRSSANCFYVRCMRCPSTFHPCVWRLNAYGSHPSKPPYEL